MAHHRSAHLASGGFDLPTRLSLPNTGQPNSLVKFSTPQTMDKELFGLCNGLLLLGIDENDLSL